MNATPKPPKKPKNWNNAFYNLSIALGFLVFIFFWFMVGFKFTAWTLVVGAIITLALLFSLFMMGLTEKD